MNQLMDGACAAAACEDDRVVLAGVHCISDDVPVEVSNKTSSFKKVKNAACTAVGKIPEQDRIMPTGDCILCN